MFIKMAILRYTMVYLHFQTQIWRCGRLSGLYAAAEHGLGHTAPDARVDHRQVPGLRPAHGGQSGMA